MSEPLKKLVGRNWPRKVEGPLVGIEVECEGGPWPEYERLAAIGWEGKRDGSLRESPDGYPGQEFVFIRPQREYRDMLAALGLAFADADTNLDFSYRTSVHVHVNVQDMTLAQYVTYVCLFGVFEELLVRNVGPKRQGNRFCLRLVDSDESLDRLIRGIQGEAARFGNRGPFAMIDNDSCKYCSMNLVTTKTFGTLEFRAMEGTMDIDRICDWINVLLTLRSKAIEIGDPRRVVEDMSAMGPQEFVKAFLPEGPLRSFVLGQLDLSGCLYDGVRVVQDLAYCTDWEEKEGEPEEAGVGIFDDNVWHQIRAVQQDIMAVRGQP